MHVVEVGESPTAEGVRLGLDRRSPEARDSRAASKRGQDRRIGERRTARAPVELERRKDREVHLELATVPMEDLLNELLAPRERNKGMGAV